MQSGLDEPSGALPRRFAGRTAVVTGAAGGIGRAIASRLSREGAHVALLDRNAAGGRETAESIAAEGGAARAYEVDVTSRDAVSRAVADIVAARGGVDVLVNNAGAGRPVAFLELTDEDWNAVMASNAASVFIVGQEVARVMAAAGGGRIVNIASLAAHTANSSQAAYAASKGAVVALTRVMAFELAPLGIAVNAISPGPIETPLAASMLTPETRRAREERIPQQRLGTPAEVAGAVAFLASSDAAYVNGATLIVDGGLLTAGIRA